jgi:hypothetical protein
VSRSQLIAYLVALLRRLLGLDKGKARLQSVTNLEALVMAKNVTLAWVNPTKRIDNTPASVSEIGEIKVSARLKALPDFTVVGTITSPTQIAAATASFPNTPSGTWIFRVEGKDTDGQPMDSFAEVEVVIPKAALAGVTNLTANVA